MARIRVRVRIGTIRRWLVHRRRVRPTFTWRWGWGWISVRESGRRAVRWHEWRHIIGVWMPVWWWIVRRRCLRGRHRAICGLECALLLCSLRFAFAFALALAPLLRCRRSCIVGTGSVCRRGSVSVPSSRAFSSRASRFWTSAGGARHTTPSCLRTTYPQHSRLEDELKSRNVPERNTVGSEVGVVQRPAA